MQDINCYVIIGDLGTIKKTLVNIGTPWDKNWVKAFIIYGFNSAFVLAVPSFRLFHQQGPITIQNHLTRPKSIDAHYAVEGVEMEEALFGYWTGLVEPVPPRNVARQVRRAFLLFSGTGLPAPEWTGCHQCSMKDNAEWSGNSFLLGSSSLANRGQLITLLSVNNPLVGLFKQVVTIVHERIQHIYFAEFLKFYLLIVLKF